MAFLLDTCKQTEAFIFEQVIIMKKNIFKTLSGRKRKQYQKNKVTNFIQDSRLWSRTIYHYSNLLESYTIIIDIPFYSRW